MNIKSITPRVAAIIVMAVIGVALLVFAGMRFASMDDPAPLPSVAAVAAPTDDVVTPQPPRWTTDPAPGQEAPDAPTEAPAQAPTPTPPPTVQPAEAATQAPAPTQVPVPTSTPAPADLPDNTVAAPPPDAAAAPSQPTSMAIPAQDIAGPVYPVAINYDINELEVPSDVHDVGWYDGGAPVGDDQGTMLLTAHVNTRTQGAGVFANLYAVEPGDAIEVTGDDGTVHSYVADQVVAQPKTELDQTIFDADGEHRLVLVTCGGELRTLPNGTRSHEDNVVVYAAPV